MNGLVCTPVIKSCTCHKPVSFIQHLILLCKVLAILCCQRNKRFINDFTSCIKELAVNKEASYILLVVQTFDDLVCVNLNCFSFFSEIENHPVVGKFFLKLDKE